MKVIKEKVNRYYEKDKDLYQNHKVEIEAKDSSIKYHVQVTEKKINITLSQLILRLKELGKYFFTKF